MLARMDRFLTAADQVLRTLFVPPRAQRACPTVPEMPNPPLSDEERRQAGALMRVNHVGEICAQALYTAQALAARGGPAPAEALARQLEAAGEKVALLVMLDTPLPMRPEIGRMDKALIKLAAIREQGPGYLLRWIRQRWAWEQHRRQARLRPPPPASSHQLHNAAIEAAFRHALPQYRVAKWTGPAVLFRPPLDLRWQVTGGRWVNTDRELVHPDNDWTRFMPALRVLEVPGTHDSMVLEPNVRVLARHMKDCITVAETQRNPT